MGAVDDTSSASPFAVRRDDRASQSLAAYGREPVHEAQIAVRVMERRAGTRNRDPRRMNIVGARHVFPRESGTHAAGIDLRRIRMTTLLTIKRLGRTAALALILAAPALTNAAHAEDPFGGDESLVLKSAQSARYSNPADTPLARATADAQVRSSALAANPSATASDAPTGRGLHDLVGQGGPQDELAREIHHTGTGTDF
jgi:hypothetical protein